MRLPKTVSFVGGVVAALVIGGGTAVASTGGSFFLGHANVAKKTTTLTDTEGLPLALKAKAGRPAFSVNTRAQINNLNSELLNGHRASDFQPVNSQAADSALLGGQPASSFLPAGGTAADAAKLGGQPASSFLPAGGTAADAAKLGGQPAASYLSSVYAATTDATHAGGQAPPLDNGGLFDQVIVPAGTYDVSLTAEIANGEASPLTAECRLRYGDSMGYEFGRPGDVTLVGNAGLAQRGTVTVRQLIAFPESTAVTVFCYGTAGNALHLSYVFGSVLTATRIQDLHGTADTFQPS